MNRLKENPVGIDVILNRIQIAIYPTLLTKWKGLDILGRAYRKRNNESSSIEVYTKKGQYEKVLFSEGNKIFFVQGNSPDINLGIAKNDIWAVCILNLDKIYPTDRADEIVHLDLVSELSNVLQPEEVIGLEYGIENINRILDDDFSFGNFKYTDVHPYHMFLVKMRLTYQMVENNC